MFVANVEQKVTYSYTNEPDGYGIEGYEDYDYLDLKETYRYHTVATDLLDRKEKYTYNGNHELLETVRTGAEHKEVIRTERDEMKLVKKKETLSYNVVN